MIIFDNTSDDFVLISADVLLKMIIILKELRIAQLCIFNNTSADFVLISAHVENDHNFERTEDCANVLLKWTDFNYHFNTF